MDEAAGQPGILPFQREGVQALLERPSLLLADEMGLGKTIQAIAALRTLIAAQPDARALVVTPASLVAQWRHELQKWAPELPCTTVRGVTTDRAWQWRTAANVFLVSYDTLRSDFTTNPHAPVAREWDVVVLDEAQRIKNRDTDAARCCKGLLRRKAWALTGTPLENSIDELASVLEFVRPRSRNERPRTLRSSDPALSAIHHSVQLRRKKSDVLPELPPKTVTSVVVELGERQRATYDRAEQEGKIQLHQLGREVRVQNVLELITRLKQICNFCPLSGESAKLDDLKGRLATVSAEDSCALVFSQYADERFGVQRLVDELAAFEPLGYTGRLSPEAREAVVRRFREDTRSRALVLSLKAGGVGLNLQQAPYVFHFDRWWNPAVEHQAEDRAHRMGQTHPVFVYTYTCTNTIEERVAAILSEKRALFDEVVDGATIDLTSTLNLSELLGLFGIERPR